MGQYRHGNGGAPGAGEFLAVGGVATAIVLPVLHVIAYIYWRCAVVTVPLTIGYVGWYHTGDIISMSSGLYWDFYNYIWWPHLRAPAFIVGWTVVPVLAVLAVALSRAYLPKMGVFVGFLSLALAARLLL